MYKACIAGCPVLVKRLFESYHGLWGNEIAITNQLVDAERSYYVTGCDATATGSHPGKRIASDNLSAIMQRVVTDTGLTSPVTLHGNRELRAYIRDNEIEPPHTPSVINLKGLTAAGKSTVAYSLIDPFLPCHTKKPGRPVNVVDPSGKVHTYVPEHNVLIFGTYGGGTGGADTFKKEDMLFALKHFWLSPCHILYEGAIVSDTAATYVLYCDKLNKLCQSLRGSPTLIRGQVYVFLHASLDLIRQRLAVRSRTNKLQDKYLDRKWSKFKHMPKTYMHWSKIYPMEIRILDASNLRAACHDMALILHMPYGSLATALGTQTDQLYIAHYQQYDRPNGRTPEDVLRISKKNSEAEDKRLHGRKIRV